jgi:DNA-directed RNA polymerase subunit RPC12/RpoP
MSEASQEVLTESVVDSSSAKEQIPCQRCGGEKVHRVFREGFLQRVVYPWFGYYPWRCTTCGYLVMLRKRHRRRSRMAGLNRDEAKLSGRNLGSKEISGQEEHVSRAFR